MSATTLPPSFHHSSGGGGATPYLAFAFGQHPQPGAVLFPRRASFDPMTPDDKSEPTNYPQADAEKSFFARYGLPKDAPQPKWGEDLPVIASASSFNRRGADGKSGRVSQN